MISAQRIRRHARQVRAWLLDRAPTYTRCPQCGVRYLVPGAGWDGLVCLGYDVGASETHEIRRCHCGGSVRAWRARLWDGAGTEVES